MDAPPVAVIAVAGGPGARLGADRPKALVEIGGRPILLHCLDSLARGFPSTTAVQRVAVVAPSRHTDEVQSLCTAPSWPWEVIVTAGGAERQDSVRAGITACADAEILIVHDVARPFLPEKVLAGVIASATNIGAAIAALPAIDTVKLTGEDGRVASTPPRNQVWLAQTPQGFRRDLLEQAHRAADNNSATDDAALLERAGHPVTIVEGDPLLRKITTTDDLRWAEWVLDSDQWPR